MRQGANPIALVTGAAAGIGKASAMCLARDGYELILMDADGERLRATKESVGQKGVEAEAVEVDLTSRDALDAAFRSVLAQVTPALLVNNAGVGAPETIVETDFGSWDRIMSLNVTAVYRACHLSIPSMVEAGGGSIINIASIAGLTGMHRRAAYSASKGAVVALTKALAIDHGGEGVRANAICPGTVSSEWVDTMIATEPDPEERRRQMAGRQLDGKMGTPEEVGEAVAFIGGARGRFMNGAAMVIDGGMSINIPV